MATQTFEKIQAIFSSLEDLKSDFIEFLQECDKEFKRFEQHTKKLKAEPSNRSRKLKPFEFSERIRREMEKMTHKNEEITNRLEIEPKASNRPKRQAAEKAKASVRKGYEFESCKKLRRPDPESPPFSSSCTRTWSEKPTLRDTGFKSTALLSRLPTIEGITSDEGIDGGEHAESPAEEVTLVEKSTVKEKVDSGSSSSFIDDESTDSNITSLSKPSSSEMTQGPLGNMQPIVVLEKLSIVDVLRLEHKSKPLNETFVLGKQPTVNREITNLVEKTSSSGQYFSCKRLASESPCMPRKKTRLSSSKKRSVSAVTNTVERRVEQQAQPRATRSRTKILIKPPVEELAVDNALVPCNYPPKPHSTEEQCSTLLTAFKTPKNLNFIAGTSGTTGGCIKMGKENIGSRIVLSSGRPPKDPRPLRYNNKQVVVGSKSAVKVPLSNKKNDVWNKNKIKNMLERKEALKRDQLLTEMRLKKVELKKGAELEAKAKFERDPMQRKIECEKKLKQAQLEKKKENEIKARRVEMRRLEQEKARAERIERQKEELRKAAEIKQRELAEAERLQQQRKKIEKQHLAKTENKVKETCQNNSKKSDEDDIELNINSKSQDRFARWADFNSLEYKEANRAQGIQQSITTEKGRLLFQRPLVTPDMHKIFGLFARVRPRTSSAVWNDTIAFSAS